MNGYIRLYRSILDWEWSNDPNTFTVFVHLLLGASFTDKRWRGMEIKAGQVVFSLSSLAKKTGLSVQRLRTVINRLKSTGEITCETTNKYSVVTIVKWAKYQTQDTDINTQATSEPTNEQHASNTQLTNNQQHRNNVKKVRREECKEGDVGCAPKAAKRSAERFTPPTVGDVDEFCQIEGLRVDAQRFVNHYTSNGWKVGRNPMKDWRATVRNWALDDGKTPIQARAAPSGQKPHYNPFLDSLREEGIVP